MPGYPCCCEPPEVTECFYCNFGDGDCVVPESFTVDFGSGGWIDDLCDYCDQLAGEFTLEHDAQANCGALGILSRTYCYYWFPETVVCTIPPFYSGTLTLWMDFIHVDPASWKIRLNIALGFALSGSYAVYESADTDSTDCLALADPGTGKITLTKQSEEHNTTPWPEEPHGTCTGALPETIYIWPDAWP